MSEKPITLASGQDDEKLDNGEVDGEEIKDDFDSSSDEEVADKDGNGGNPLLQGEIGCSATFLLALVHGLDLVELFASIIVSFVV